MAVAGWLFSGQESHPIHQLLIKVSVVKIISLSWDCVVRVMSHPPTQQFWFLAKVRS
jgi:hypothetical protein